MKNRVLINKNVYYTTCMVMLKRIAKGYSARELSFLIGCTPDYVDSVEMLKGEGYNPEEIRRIALALEETNMNSFYLPQETAKQVDAEMECFIDGRNLVHKSSIFIMPAEAETTLTLLEPLGKHQNTSTIDETDAEMAKSAVQLLIKAGYFYKPHTNQEIFAKINQFLTAGTLCPFHIEEALTELSTNYNTAVVEKISVDDLGDSYVEC